MGEPTYFLLDNIPSELRDTIKTHASLRGRGTSMKKLIVEILLEYYEQGEGAKIRCQIESLKKKTSPTEE